MFFIFLKQSSQQINRCFFNILLHSKLYRFCHFLSRNIILHQKLHINHKKKSLSWRYFDLPDTLSFSPSNCCIYSLCFCLKTLINALSIAIFLNLYYTFITYDGQKKTSNEQKVTSNEEKVMNSKEKVTTNKQKLTSNKQKLTNKESKIFTLRKLLSFWETFFLFDKLCSLSVSLSEKCFSHWETFILQRLFFLSEKLLSYWDIFLSLTNFYPTEKLFPLWQTFFYLRNFFILFSNNWFNN